MTLPGERRPGARTRPVSIPHCGASEGQRCDREGAHPAHDRPGSDPGTARNNPTGHGPKTNEASTEIKGLEQRDQGKFKGPEQILGVQDPGQSPSTPYWEEARHPRSGANLDLTVLVTKMIREVVVER